MTFQDTLRDNALLTAHYLKTSFSHNSGIPEHLFNAMHYAVMNGGKRFRPFLVLECAKLFGVTQEEALPTAAALECVHCYSLVHDDLPAMDDDDLRRGKPTVHVAFDEATAILAGDGLLTYAFEILSSAGTHSDASLRAELILELARASGWSGMVGGQALDLKAEGNGELTLDEVAQIQIMKTGALIRFACEAGAILGHADSRERQALVKYGDNLGRAFQIADDLLDIEGDPEMIGKATLKDMSAGKATFVSLLGVDQAKSELEKLKGDAVEAISIFGERAANLIEAANFTADRNH